STTQVQQSAEFFAKLASSHQSWRRLTAKEKTALLEDFKQFLTQHRDKLPKFWQKRLSQLENMRRVVLVYLEDIARMAYYHLSQLLNGRPVDRGEVSRMMWLRGRSVVMSLEPPETAIDEYLESREPPVKLGIQQFYQLLEHRPFPFGQCLVCKRIFVQMGRGK